MQNINTSYTVYVNRRHGRSGHLFQGRYKGVIVDKEGYLLEVGRYIHLNPPCLPSGRLRAGLVKHPREYRWTSYREYVYRAKNTTVVDIGDTLFYFSQHMGRARRGYEEFVKAGMK